MSKPKAITNKGIILFKDYELLFNFLSDEETGKVIKKLLENFDNGKLKKCKNFENKNIENVYTYISNRINDYLQKSQKAKEVGALGGNPTLNQTLNTTLKGTDNGIDNGEVNLKEEKIKEEKIKEDKIKEENKTEEYREQILKNWYGEYKNVYLDESDYRKALTICLDVKYLNELIEAVGEAIEKGKYNVYDETRPHAHLAVIKAFHKHRMQNPDKYKPPQNQEDEIERLKRMHEEMMEKERLEG